MIRIISVVVISILLFCCENKEKQSEMPADTDSLETAADSLQAEFNENAPEWFNHIPEAAGYIYAAAEGVSIRANIAEQKAMLKARAKLAEKAEELMQDSDGSSSGPGADSETEKDTRSIILERSIVKYKKQLLIDKKWHVFVLVELKTD